MKLEELDAELLRQRAIVVDYARSYFRSDKGEDQRKAHDDLRVAVETLFWLEERIARVVMADG